MASSAWLGDPRNVDVIQWVPASPRNFGNYTRGAFLGGYGRGIRVVMARYFTKQLYVAPLTATRPGRNQAAKITETECSYAIYVYILTNVMPGIEVTAL